MGLRSGVSLCWQDCDGDTSQKKIEGEGICGAPLLFLPRFVRALPSLPPSRLGIRDRNGKNALMFPSIEDALRCDAGLLFRRELLLQIWMISAFVFVGPRAH